MTLLVCCFVLVLGIALGFGVGRAKRSRRTVYPGKAVLLCANGAVVDWVPNPPKDNQWPDALAISRTSVTLCSKCRVRNHPKDTADGWAVFTSVGMRESPSETLPVTVYIHMTEDCMDSIKDGAICFWLSAEERKLDEQIGLDRILGEPKEGSSDDHAG